MKHISVLFALVFLAALPSCQRSDIHQTIKQMTEYPVDTTGFSKKTIRTNTFSSVEIDCFADVTFHQTASGKHPYIRIMARKDVLDHVITRTTENDLLVATERRYRMPERDVILVDIYAPFISRFTLNGGKCLRLGRMKVLTPLTIESYGIGGVVADRIEAPEIDVMLSGDGNIDLKDIATSQFSGTIHGNGRIYLDGRTASYTSTLDGNGKIDTTRLSIIQ